MSRKNIEIVSAELQKQGYKFVLSGIDEQGRFFFEFHGKTPEEAVELHFNTMERLCVQTLLGGSDEQMLRKYLNDVVKTSFTTVRNYRKEDVTIMYGENTAPPARGREEGGDER